MISGSHCCVSLHEEEDPSSLVLSKGDVGRARRAGGPCGLPGLLPQGASDWGVRGAPGPGVDAAGRGEMGGGGQQAGRWAGVQSEQQAEGGERSCPRGAALPPRPQTPAPLPPPVPSRPLGSPVGPAPPPCAGPQRLPVASVGAGRGGAGAGAGPSSGPSPCPLGAVSHRLDPEPLRSGRVRRGLPTRGQVRPWAARSVSAPGRSDLAFAAGRARRGAPTSTAGLARRPRVRAWGASRGGPSVCSRLSWGRAGLPVPGAVLRPRRLPSLPGSPICSQTLGRSWAAWFCLGPGDISGGSGAQLTPMRGPPPTELSTGSPGVLAPLLSSAERERMYLVPLEGLAPRMNSEGPASRALGLQGKRGSLLPGSRGEQGWGEHRPHPTLPRSH